MDSMKNLVDFDSQNRRRNGRRIGSFPQAAARPFLIDTVAIRNRRNVLKIKSGDEF